MLHPRTELDAYANSWPEEADTRPGHHHIGDWPGPPTPPRSGQARHRRRQRGRHRAHGGNRTAYPTDRTTRLAADAVADMTGHRAATHTLGPFALPPGGVPPVDAWPAEVTPGEVGAPETPPETPAEQTRPAGWWRVPGDAEPRHPRARPPAATRAAAEPAPVAERDRRPWLAGTALFVAVAIAGSWAISSRQHPSDELPPPDTTAYGATGRLPDSRTDSAAPNNAGASRTGGGLSRTGGEATLAATSGAPGVAAVGDPRIPATMARAYRGAEARLAATAPDCGLSWSLLAGIGKVESDHARGGAIDAEGTTRAPILGPALDGTSGNAAIPDTDNGALDRDTRWDRAVGPSQFIPTSWDIYGADGNDDGRTDPNNAYDAATATGRYLCAGGLDLSDPVDLNTAVFRYNHSQDYVDTVLGWARTYAGAPGADAGEAPPVAAPKQTVIPVPPAASPPPRAGAPTPTTSVPGAREQRRPAASSRPAPRPAASSSAPAPRPRDSRHQAPRPARPHGTPSRPSRAAAPPARPAPAPTIAPDTSSSTPTDSTPTDPTPAPTRRPVPRTTTLPPTTPKTTRPPATSTPASPPGSPATDPRSPGCLLQPTTPTPTPTPTLAPTSGLPELPGSALLGDLAGSITLRGDCCNDG